MTLLAVCIKCTPLIIEGCCCWEDGEAMGRSRTISKYCVVR